MGEGEGVGSAVARDILPENALNARGAFPKCYGVCLRGGTPRARRGVAAYRDVRAEEATENVSGIYIESSMGVGVGCSNNATIELELAYSNQAGCCARV